MSLALLDASIWDISHNVDKLHSRNFGGNILYNQQATR
jgi:hypothetical protein